MDVSVEQCPEPIRAFVASTECLKCNTKPGSGLAAQIRYQPPVYFVQLTCVKCGQRANATFLGPGPCPAAVATTPTAEPSWYAHVEGSK